MIVTANISEIRSQRWRKPDLSWGLVPTMGALHRGHIALVDQARAANDRLAVSIFVNPTQFAAGEDLSTYPRTLENDLELLKDAGVDLVFTPNDKIMYPDGFQTAISLPKLAGRLEGASRPTHFAGVAVVVCKLFNIFQPTRAYFGQKDAQQTIILRQMIDDLNMNLELIVCPTVRATDGLALSSRNSYLTPEQREAAPILHQALQKTAARLRGGERDGDRLRAILAEMISSEPLGRLDYASVADLKTLEEVEKVKGDVLISAALFFGSTRLIDNEMVYFWEQDPLKMSSGK